jgi:hypothetical protein
MHLVRRSIVFLVCVIFPQQAMFAQNGAWWEQYKANCRNRGGTICDYYNQCNGVCTMPDRTGGGTAIDSHTNQPPGPHLINKDSKWSPEDGYDWKNEIQADTDFRVRWVPNKRSNSHQNVVTSENEGRWLPEDGYEWIEGDGDLGVRWVPNRRSRSQHVVTTEIEGRWRPEDGYDWQNEIQSVTDNRVKWVPNKPSDTHPNVVTTETEGRWRPEQGYKFLNPGSGDLIAVDNGRVDEVIRAAKVVVSLNEQKGRLEELSGLAQYDRVESALKILGTNWVIVMPLAASAAQREILIQHTKKELRDLLNQVLQASVNQISNDIHKLSPWEWNLLRLQELRLFAEMDREVLALRERANHEIYEEATFHDIRSGSQRSALQYNSAQALRQLLDINNQRRWAK